MRLSKAWTVASKDFRTFRYRKSILYSILYFEAIVSIGLPFVLRYVASRPNGTAALPALMDAFSFFFVIGGALMPVGVASYSLIGEKVQKSLEPLLATPTTDEEILAGKTIAAFLPAICVNSIGAVIFATLVDLFTRDALNGLYYPNWNLAIIVFLLAPLACILSVGYNVLISSRANDVRTAQQLGSLIILPLGAVYLLAELRVLDLSNNNLLIMAGCLAAIDVVVFLLAKATFQRDEILTKWK